MVQRTPTPDPLVGAALSNREGELYLDGLPSRIPGGPLFSGQSVRVVLRANDFVARVGQGRRKVVLLAGREGWAWEVAAVWDVDVDFRTFPVYTYASRLPDGKGVVLVLTPIENPERAELALGDLYLSQAWGGFRRRRDGSPGFVFILPREAFGEGLVKIYKGGRYGQGAFSLPPWPSSSPRTPVWRLPFWLPENKLPLAHILEAVARVLPNGEDLVAQINPDKAQGQYLSLHAALFAAPPDIEEPEGALRIRLKALPGQRYTSIPALRSHFRALAQGGVVISDDSNPEDGDHPTPTLGPGRYLVRFYDTPMPWPYYVKELMRLRPAGLEPVLQRSVGESGNGVRLGVAVVGTMEPVIKLFRDIPLGDAMVTRGDIVLSPDTGDNLLEFSRDVPLARLRQLDGSWELDGSVRLVSGMVLRDEIALLLNRDVPLAGGRQLDGSWQLDGSVRLASGMVTRGEVSVSP
jgi:hypothetical protein